MAPSHWRKRLACWIVLSSACFCRAVFATYVAGNPNHRTGVSTLANTVARGQLNSLQRTGSRQFLHGSFDGSRYKQLRQDWRPQTRRPIDWSLGHLQMNEESRHLTGDNDDDDNDDDDNDDDDDGGDDDDSDSAHTTPPTTTSSISSTSQTGTTVSTTATATTTSSSTSSSTSKTHTTRSTTETTTTSSSTSRGILPGVREIKDASEISATVHGDSTLLEGAGMEGQRLSEEAAELVERVKEAENAMMMMMMLKEHSTLPSSMGNVLWTWDWESEVGTSTFAMLRKPTLSMSRPQGAVMLPVAKGSATLSIPLAVVAQVPTHELPRDDAIGAIVLATRFTEEAVALFSDPQYTLLEPPLSLRILGADGENYLEGVRLAEPIDIKLQEVRTPGVVCAYLDEETGAWRRDGVVEVWVDGDDGLYCHTSHLTIFAPILQKVEFLVTCSQVHLMSESGLRSISRGKWCVMPAAVFYWLMLLLQGALCILAVKWDSKATDEESWKDSMLLTENAAYKRTDSLVESSVQQVESLLDMDFLTRFCTYRALAYSMRVTACDVEQIVRGSRRSTASDTPPAFHDLPAEKSPSINPSISTCPSTPDVLSRVSVKSAWEVGSEPSKESSGGSLAEAPKRTSHTSAESRLALKICDEAVSIVEDFWQRSFWHRTWIIFSAEHPWIQTNYFSITRAAATRALLLSAQVMGSMMLSAAFFVNMNDAFSKESPGECQPESLSGRLKWNVTIGAISSLFCYLPLCIITSILCGRQFVYKEQWDDEEKKRLLRSWRMRDVALWFVVVMYVGWSILFTVLFLANVSFKSGLHWTVASLSNFIRDFFLLPLAIAGLLNVFATLAHHIRPSLVKRVCNEFNILRGGRHGERCSCYVYEEPSPVIAESLAKSSHTLSAIVQFGCGSSSLQILSWTADVFS